MNEDVSAADKMRRIADEKVAAKDRTALLHLLDAAEGRWFLMRLFERCHLVKNTSFLTSDLNDLLVKEGERRVGMYIESILTQNAALLAAKQKAETEYHAFMQEMESLIRAAEQDEEESV